MNRADSFDHVVGAPTDSSAAPKERLFTFRSGGWVLLAAFVLCLGAAALVLKPVWETGMHRAVGDGEHIETYGFDLSNLAIPRETLVAPGVSKDQIRAIPPGLVQTLSPEENTLRNQNDRRNKFLVTTDRVIGVSLNGETRAYPLRVLSYHEVINDVLGGVPIVVAYSPLCDSATVFDRRIDGENAPPVEFGVSGLLADSNLVMFDRRKDPRQESLWPQLGLKAVSGPKLGQTLKLLPFDVVTWKRWTERHPDTRAVEGLRTLKQQYNKEPFNAYYGNDDLKFPVDPRWDKNDLKMKTPIVASSTDGGKSWQARRASSAWLGEGVATAPVTSNEIRVYSFLFAWYAQHPEDTDYSALLQ